MPLFCSSTHTAFCALDAALPAILALATAALLLRAALSSAAKSGQAIGAKATSVPANAVKVVAVITCSLQCLGHLTWAIYAELERWPVVYILYDAAFFIVWTIAVVGQAWAWRLRCDLKLWAVAWPAVAVYGYSIVAAATGWDPPGSTPGGTGRQREALLVLRAANVALALAAAVALSLRRQAGAEGDDAALREGLLGKDGDDVEAGAALKEGEAPPRTHTTAQLLRTALRLAWPTTAALKMRVAGTILMICVGRVLNLAVPILYGRMLDRLSDASAATHATQPVFVSTAQVLFPAVTVYLLVNAVPSLGLLSKTRVFLWFPVMQAASRRAKVELLEHMLQMDLKFHLMRKTGEVTRKMDRGTSAMTSIMRTFFLSLIPQAIDIVGAVGYLATRMHAWVAVILAFTFVTYVPLSVYATRRRNALQRSMNKRDNVMYARSTDALVNYETVKYFGNEALEARKYGEVVDLFQAWRYKMNTSLVWVDILQSAIVYSGTVIGLVVCANGVANGTLTVGGVGVFLSLVSTLMRPLYSFEELYETITQDFVDMEQMFDLLEQAPAVQDHEGARDLVVSEGAVEYENVSFAYTPGTLILKDVSFRCPGGKTLALVGHTGSGKSTALRLLFRFYDPLSGRIAVDGTDIAGVTQASLRAAMAVVPQDTVLFNESIRENIRYGRPGASDAEVEAAARAAAIHDHIASPRFPDGYATVVGERGLRLSGLQKADFSFHTISHAHKQGEKQRVAVARAVLKDPRILLLDEATSALDSLTEDRIKQAVNALRATRTTIIVAHRLSTIMDADTLVVLQEGAVVEVGSHAELVERGGHFADMWARQSQLEAGTAPRGAPPAPARGRRAGDDALRMRAAGSRALVHAEVD